MKDEDNEEDKEEDEGLMRMGMIGRES